MTRALAVSFTVVLSLSAPALAQSVWNIEERS
jgi:hypothetical protein